jgi:hypothetical protein
MVLPAALGLATPSEPLWIRNFLPNLEENRVECCWREPMILAVRRY